MIPRCRYCEGRLDSSDGHSAHPSCAAIFRAVGWRDTVEAMARKERT